MAFKSEAHKRWWHANNGRGSGMGYSAGFSSAMRRFGDDLRKKNDETRRSLRRNGHRMTAGDRRWNFAVLVSQRAYSVARSGYNNYRNGGTHATNRVNAARARSIERQSMTMANMRDRQWNNKLRSGMDNWQSWNRVNHWQRRLEREKLRRHGWI